MGAAYANSDHPSKVNNKRIKIDDQQADVEIYGPVGLRNFINTSLLLSRSYLGFTYRVVELLPSEHAESESFKLCNSEESLQPTSSLRKIDLNQVEQMTAPKHPQEIVSNKEPLKFDENLGGYEIFSDQNLKCYASTLIHTVPCFSYFFQGLDKPGALNVEKLKSDGLKAGKHFGQLKAGKDIEFDGKIFKSSDYTLPPTPGPCFNFNGDTNDASITAAMINKIRNTKSKLFCVHESTKQNELESDSIQHGHSSPNLAANFALSVNADLLILDHFSQRYYDETDPECDPSLENPHIHTGILKSEAELVLKNKCRVETATDNKVIILRLFDNK